MYSQSNLCDKVLCLQSFQPCPQDYFMIVLKYSIQPSRWNVANIGTALGDIIYGV